MITDEQIDHAIKEFHHTLVVLSAANPASSQNWREAMRAALATMEAKAK